MGRIKIAGGIACLGFLAACGGGASPGANSAGGDPNIETLQTLISGQGPQWSAADAANGNPDAETVTSVNCIATSVGNYSCNAYYTVTGGTYPTADGKWTVTIPGSCDTSGKCQTQVSGSAVRAG
jgi:hypothetical protein